MVNLHYPIEFRGHRSNRCWDKAIFRFLKMTAVRRLGFVVLVFGPPMIRVLDSAYQLQNLVRIDAVVLITFLIIFCKLDLKMPHTPKWWLLLIWPLKGGTYQRDPKRHSLARKDVMWRKDRWSTGASSVWSKYKVLRSTKKPKTRESQCSPRPPTLWQHHMDLRVWSYIPSFIKICLGFQSHGGVEIRPLSLVQLLTFTTASTIIQAVMSCKSELISQRRTISSYNQPTSSAFQVKTVYNKWTSNSPCNKVNVQNLCILIIGSTIYY